MKTVVFALVTSFHDLFMVIWVGGLIITVISYLPALKSVISNSPQTKSVMTAFQKRQSIWVYISMVGLILTGIMLSRRDPAFIHLFSTGNPYSIALTVKHILILVMIGITLYRSLVLGHKRSVLTPKKEKLSRQLLVINAILSVLVLFSSGAVAAIGTL